MIIGHCDAHWHDDPQQDFRYYLPILERGACCEFDLIGWTELAPDDVRPIVWQRSCREVSPRNYCSPLILAVYRTSTVAGAGVTTFCGRPSCRGSGRAGVTRGANPHDVGGNASANVCERLTMVNGRIPGWIGIVMAVAALAPAAAAQTQPFSSRTVETGGLKVTVGPLRMIMRGPMFPWAMQFDDGSIVVVASSGEEGGPVQYLRSTDQGETWRPFKRDPGYTLPMVLLRDGLSLFASTQPTPIPDRPGYYKTARFESKDRGLTCSGSGGELYLPPEVCSPKMPHMFHGNMIATSHGDLLSVMQGMETEAIPEWPEGGKTPYQCYLVKSTDQARTWRYVSHVASLRELTGPNAAALKTGWRTWGPCESALMEVGEGRLVCVMRTLNDDLEPLISAPSDSYRDLFSTLRGVDIYKGSLNLPDDKFFTLSKPTLPLIICYSEDGGEHWTPPAPMRKARLHAAAGLRRADSRPFRRRLALPSLGKRHLLQPRRRSSVVRCHQLCALLHYRLHRIGGDRAWPFSGIL